jgi:hypothetical protein
MRMRHCDQDCGILKYIPSGLYCPILEMKQIKKKGNWWIEDGESNLKAFCEDVVVRVSTKRKIKILK